MSILKLQSVYKSFGGFHVLRDVNLEVEELEKHVIIGPNGAGKSTLFNVITGFHKITKGKIIYDSVDITSKKIHKIARLGLSRSFQISQIFQDMTVYENIRNSVMSKMRRRLSITFDINKPKRIKEECEKIITMLQLGPVENKMASDINYGSQRKLEIGLCLAMDPKLILMDEPTAGLDAEETYKFVKLIKQITTNKTLIVVEHDMDIVFDLADKITVLDYGRKLVTGTASEVKNNEEVQRCYLRR